MKKLIIILALLAIPFGSSAYVGPVFNDIEDSPYKMAIEDLFYRGIVDGYADGSFRPNDPVNRVEALKIVLNSVWRNVVDNWTEVDYSDVSKTDWFYEYVREGFLLNFLDGYPDGTFKPADTVNLAELMKMQLSGYPFHADDAVALFEDPFKDVSVDSWYAKHASTAKYYSLVDADEEGNLNAWKDLTRGEVAEFIYRSLFVLDINKDRPYGEYDYFDTYNHDVWFDTSSDFEVEPIADDYLNGFYVTHKDYPDFKVNFVGDFPISTVNCVTENIEKDFTYNDYVSFDLTTCDDFYVLSVGSEERFFDGNMRIESDFDVDLYVDLLKELLTYELHFKWDPNVN